MQPETARTQQGVARPQDMQARLVLDLPPEWQTETIQPTTESWSQRIEAGRRPRRLQLAGLPPRIRIELTWMAYWQYCDGSKVAVSEFNQAASLLRWAFQTGRSSCGSIIDVDRASFARLYRAWFESRHGRLPANSSARDLLSVLFGYPRQALLARSNESAWWALDDWIPRCDPRIPLRDREPRRAEGCRPGRARIRWVGDAIKWHLGCALETGTLTWSTVLGQRTPSLLLFDRWLSSLDDPAQLTTDLPNASKLAASFRNWVSNPLSRSGTAPVPAAQRSSRAVNTKLRAVVDLLTFVADNRETCHRLMGPSPWDHLTEDYPAIWSRQIGRARSRPFVNHDHYLDDHAIAQISACLPVLAATPDETVTVTINGVARSVSGCGDAQAMRILLLQMLTGRRASEICLCEFDCLAPAANRVVQATDSEEIARFRYAQSKIDRAPDTILVDAEVVAVIKEQQAAVSRRFPNAHPPRYLFPQQSANTHGHKPITASNYHSALREFSGLVKITDSSGRAVRLSRTHRFRHTRITRLAELGLPVHVLQRYAGHANPTMSMHYVAQREEHAEQAFLATRKFKADGTAVTFAREDHDGMHLFDRADRFLPHGYCLLPPLQQCDKGNACLTCSVFVTDTSHLDTLQRQLGETNALIDRTTEQFKKSHGKPIPDDNVWLVQRTAERNALVKLIATMQQHPARACQGAGSSTSGPVPITIDTTSHRKRVS
jgi:integrase